MGGRRRRSDDGPPEDWLAEYVAELRKRAEERRREGWVAGAQLYELVANELDAKRRTSAHETVSMGEAMEITGYSRASLWRLLKAGTITLRRCDLPRRPGHGVHPVRDDDDGVPSVADLALAGRALTRRGTRRRRTG